MESFASIGFSGFELPQQCANCTRPTMNIIRLLRAIEEHAKHAKFYPNYKEHLYSNERSALFDILLKLGQARVEQFLLFGRQGTDGMNLVNTVDLCKS